MILTLLQPDPVLRPQLGLPRLASVGWLLPNFASENKRFLNRHCLPLKSCDPTQLYLQRALDLWGPQSTLSGRFLIHLGDLMQPWAYLHL